MSHPQLNGCLGTLDAVEESSDGGPRWLVSVKGQQYSLPEEKLRLEPVPEALVTDPPPSTDELPHSQEKPDPATAATEPTSSRAEPSEAAFFVGIVSLYFLFSIEFQGFELSFCSGPGALGAQRSEGMCHLC